MVWILDEVVLVALVSKIVYNMYYFLFYNIIQIVFALLTRTYQGRSQDLRSGGGDILSSQPRVGGCPGRVSNWTLENFRNSDNR